MTGPTARLWAGVLLLLALVVAYVIMGARSLDAGPIGVIVGPVVLYLILGAKVDAGVIVGEAGRAAQDATLAEQDATLAAHSAALTTITRQTNGVLDARIREAAGAALIAHLVNAGAAASPEPSPATPPPTTGDLSP